MPPRKERVHLVCVECREDFYRLPCQLTRGRGKYCSRGCAGKALERRSEIQCEQCGSHFERHLSEQDIGDKVNQFCSRDCYTEWRRTNMGRDTYPKGEGGVHKHRLVAEAVLGRPLKPQEVVHHIDENKHNWHPSNLAVLPDQAVHASVHRGGLPEVELDKYRLVSLASREAA
jgi:hypothetical protein